MKLTMENQKIFKSDYIRKLRTGVENGNNLIRYESESFEFNKDEILIYPNISKPKDLLNSFKFTDELDTAIKIFEAYSDLELIQASDRRLWIYLSHAELYPYVKYRWDSEVSSRYILDHWFINSSTQANLLRHSVSQLWWAVHLSVDCDRSNKYELTEILFNQRDFPFRTLGTYEIGRHKEAVIGILEFIKRKFRRF